MGCKSSKPKKLFNKKVIKHEMKQISIPYFDKYFQDVSKLLQSAEKIRTSLEDCPEEATRIANTDRLKSFSFADTLQVLAWALSAGSSGQINKLEIAFIEEPPYCTCKTDMLCAETFDLWESFQRYMAACGTSYKELQGLEERLVKYQSELGEIVKNSKEQVDEEKLTNKEVQQIRSNIMENVKLIESEVPKVRKIVTKAKYVDLKVDESLPKLRKMVAVADEIGEKAYKDDIIKPAEIFNRFHNGDRRADMLRKNVGGVSSQEKKYKANEGEMK